MAKLHKNPTRVDLEENEIAIEVHCESGEIMNKKGSREQIGICGFLRRRRGRRVGGRNKDLVHLEGIPIALNIGKRPMVSASSYYSGILAAFLGFATARFLRSLLVGLLL